MQAVVWTAVGVLSLLIVASRKHYSVDVLVAWYARPMARSRDPHPQQLNRPPGSAYPMVPTKTLQHSAGGSTLASNAAGPGQES